MTLNDGMSAVLKKITSALDITLNSFEQVQRASGRAVNAAQIAQARSQLVGANAQLDEMAENYRRAAQQEENLNRGLRNGTAAADGLLGKVKNIVTTLAAGVGVKMFAGLSDQLASGRARMSLLVDDGGSVSEFEQKIMASAQRSRSYYMDTMQTVSKLGLTAGDAFKGNDEIIAFTELLNKNFVIGGASATEQAAAMYQLTQAMGSGRLQGDEYRSIIENAPLLANAIEDYMRNVKGAEGSMKDWASEGLLTSDVIKAALFSSADEIESRFAQMPLTWGQIWVNMKNKALAIFDPILTRMNEVANSEQFDTTVDGLITGMATVGALATWLFDLMVNMGSGISENWGTIEPIVWGIAAALIAYNAVALITNGINAAVALSASVKAAAEMMSTGATFAATAAQHGLNAALLACPITWIVVGVLALIVAIVALCNWIAKTTGVAQSGFGVITGGIFVVGATFKNLGLLIANIALGIWSALGAVCSNIGTAFHNTIANVQGWFYGLLATALTVVEGICAALNKLPFVEFDYSGITAKADEYAAKSAEAYGSKEEYTSVGDAFSEGFNTFDAFQEGWASDAFKAGASWGDGVADKVGGLFDFDLGAAGDYENGGFSLDNIAADTGSIADSTGGMADALTVNNEQLEYLRDIAERDAVNRFTTAEVKIDMTGMTNRIDGGADLDGVLTTLTDGFAEALVTAAEGVHE